MTEFVSVDRDFERHKGDSRPKILLPTGGHAYYSRVTTFVDCIEDKFNLQKWDKRMVAIGLAGRPDLLMSVQAHLNDKRQLDRICDDAKAAAKASAAATTGTALHAFTDMLDQGQELPVGLAAGARASLEKFQEATADLKVVAIEKKLVQDMMKAAGTADRIYEYQGKRYIGDTKSGNVELGIIKIAAQLAMYARSKAYDVATGARTPIDVELDRALVMHMPAVEDPADAKCELVWVDIKAGWQMVLLARQIREARKQKFDDLAAPFGTVDPFLTADERTDVTINQALASARPTEASKAFVEQGVRRLHLLDLIEGCTTADEVRALWATHASEWDDIHTEAAKHHIAKLPAA